MRKFMAILLVLLSILSLAAAEETAEYRGDFYAFRYPASWSCSMADNGDIILVSPDENSAVLTFAIINDMITLTGDPETDAPLIDSMITGYSGNNLMLNGEYDLIETGGMHGFRAYGTWATGSLDAAMVILTGDRHMVGFVLAGADAILLEPSLLESLEILGGAPSEGSDGFSRWNAAAFSLEYPEAYGTMDVSTGVAFINPANPNSIIMARSYNLDTDYTDDLAPAIASYYLPKSTQVEPNPEMVEIGGRKAAVIRGTVSDGPMEFYIIGSGRTAVALMFTGEEPVSIAGHIIQSVEIK